MSSTRDLEAFKKFRRNYPHLSTNSFYGMMLQKNQLPHPNVIQYNYDQLRKEINNYGSLSTKRKSNARHLLFALNQFKNYNINTEMYNRNMLRKYSNKLPNSSRSKVNSLSSPSRNRVVSKSGSSAFSPNSRRLLEEHAPGTSTFLRKIPYSEGAMAAVLSAYNNTNLPSRTKQQLRNI